ncbi:unnamed protein product [Owenia fusiformis]|uniref:Uncharacterized protein n=1 Tax=Owenia fusiformis TaxID=6347 RepID=A0A8J1TVG8_OWEFU|nr:unnamed protein product [Owenia fusiformis]
MQISKGITGTSLGMLNGLLVTFVLLDMVTQAFAEGAYTGKPSLSLKVSPMESQSGYAPSFGAEIRLRCQITALPHIDAKNTMWKFNNAILFTGNKYTLNKVPSMGSVDEVTMILTIHHINIKDVGNYTCEAKNSDGMYKHATVEIKPMGRKEIDFKVYTKASSIETRGRGRIGGPPGSNEKNVTVTQTTQSSDASDIRAMNIEFITIGLIVFSML